jgi:hypothetical protein
MKPNSNKIKKAEKALYDKFRIYHVDEDKILLEKLKDYIKHLKESEKVAWNQLKEYSKEKEIDSLNEQIDSIKKNSIYIMTDKEKSELQKFKDKHDKDCDKGFSYMFKGNGIGQWIEIKCEECEEVQDIVDHESW